MKYRFTHGNLSFDDILEGAIKSLQLNCSFLQAVNFAENPALEFNDNREEFGLLTIDETKGEPVSTQSYTSNVCTLSVCTTSSMTIPAVCTSTSTRVTHSCATPIFTTSTPMVQRRDSVEKYNEVGDISVEFHGFPQTPERSAEVMENTNIQRPIVGMQGGLRDGLGFLHTCDSAPLRLHGDQVVSDSTMFNPAVEVPNSRGRKSTGMEVNDDRRMDLDERKRNLPHRNAMPQTQDTTPHPVTVYRHGADLSLCYPLTWNVTLEYTATHFNVLGETRPGNPSPTFYTHKQTLNLMLSWWSTVGSSVESTVPTGTCGVRIQYAIRSPTATSTHLRFDIHFFSPKPFIILLSNLVWGYI